MGNQTYDERRRMEAERKRDEERVRALRAQNELRGEECVAMFHALLRGDAYVEIEHVDAHCNRVRIVQPKEAD